MTIKKHDREVDLSCVHICPLLNELYTYLQILKYIGKPDHCAFSLLYSSNKIHRERNLKRHLGVLLRIDFQRNGEKKPLGTIILGVLGQMDKA